MATKVEKLSSGNYRVRTSYVDATGKQRFKSFTAETPKEAKYLALQFEVDNKHKSKPENISLGDAIERYIINRENLLSPSTIRGYYQLKRNAYPSIIETRLGNIQREDIQKVINDYAANHAAKSVKNALGLLSVVLKEVYPSIDLNGIKLPQEKKTDFKILTKEDVDMLEEEIKGTPMYLPILLGSRLGLRRSEVFALTWEDIDFENDTITIDKAMVPNQFNEFVIKSTKTTESERTLELPKIIKEEILNKSTEQPLIELNINQFAMKYIRLTKRLGMSEAFHALRHYNASVMLQMNVPNKYAMERMGHATDNMLKRVYQHTFKSEKDLIAKRLEQFFEGNKEE